MKKFVKAYFTQFFKNSFLKKNIYQISCPIIFFSIIGLTLHQKYLKCNIKRINPIQKSYVLNSTQKKNRNKSGQNLFDEDIYQDVNHQKEIDLGVALPQETQIKLFAGQASKNLGKEIATHLDIQLGRMTIKKNERGDESFIQIHDSIAGQHVYIIQSLGPPYQENFLELLLMISTFKRSKAAKVTAVIPYLGYTRRGNPFSNERYDANNYTLSDMARMIEEVGCDQIITANLHNNDVKGFFNIPLINIDVSKIVVPYLKQQKLQNLVLVSPDVKKSYLKRVMLMMDHLEGIGKGCKNIATIVKTYRNEQKVEIGYMGPNLFNSDVLIVDSIVDTAKSLFNIIYLLKQQGAQRIIKSIFMFAPHGILSGHALKRIQSCPLTQLILTDTIQERECLDKIRYLNIGKIFATIIAKIQTNQSLEQFRNSRKNFLLQNQDFNQ